MVYFGGYSVIGIVLVFIVWIRTFVWVVVAFIVATGLYLKFL